MSEERTNLTYKWLVGILCAVVIALISMVRSQDVSKYDGMETAIRAVAAVQQTTQQQLNTLTANVDNIRQVASEHSKDIRELQRKKSL